MNCFQFVLVVVTMACSLWLSTASSAAGTETLVGIVGNDFVLLGADSSVSQSIALTASNLDKIAHLVDPKIPQPQTILAAAAGDAADSDRLLGYLKAIGALEEYKNGGCDVRRISLGSKPSSRSASGLDARSMAHLARRCIWERLRSRTPYRICLLVAGMEQAKTNTKSKAEFLSQTVQTQVQEARSSVQTQPTGDLPVDNCHDSEYKPALFWLDEYGSLQQIEYGCHGHGSNFLLSILDQKYRPDLTQDEALELMHECFQELRGRYVINSPEDPCIKCVDRNGVKIL